ncbi:hypothetical protein BRDID11004_47890 [Bradyrhizobium diazoefficiens]|uniref:Uncharacterized protein n=1 Tax=Bradyrhizobium diazoefficiens TaxID=1355477 RepID=A0A809ZUX7_9BRAD|nr:hypothetical protein [Bradyrhizobium diazoefficiens]BBZ94308.1 hypothetical protein F07S3_41410 [Bradyrhizobium diazoefficiens]BCE56396.1 hypothetical protein XF5B_39080 [Bradyrhizobium diazoefficiens]
MSITCFRDVIAMLMVDIALSAMVAMGLRGPGAKADHRNGSSEVRK